jgi:hypothetical protein
VGELYKRIEAFPSYIERSNIRQSIKCDQTEGSILIAQMDTQEIIVRKEFAKEPILKSYMKKHYADLLKGVKTTSFK